MASSLYRQLAIVASFLGPLFILYTLSAKKRDGFEGTPSYYTMRRPTADGFGSQYHAIMSAIAYCDAKGLIYAHSPMETIDHGGNPKQLNEFIGITTTPMASELDSVTAEEVAGEVHYAQRPSEYYTPEVIQRLRKYYYSTPKPTIERNDIAVHIRRGDVNQSETMRYTSDDENKRILDMLRKQYPTQKITVHSEGNLDEFSELTGENIEFKLNEDVRHTFHSFVTAKVLVTAKSSLSYSAAILNEGTVYYQPYIHKPLDGWKNVL